MAIIKVILFIERSFSMNNFWIFIKTILCVAIALPCISFSDTLSAKEKQYIQSISKNINKNQSPQSIPKHVLSAKEATYLNEKSKLIESHSNLNEKEKELLVAEHKRKFFGGTDTALQICENQKQKLADDVSMLAYIEFLKGNIYDLKKIQFNCIMHILLYLPYKSSGFPDLGSIFKRIGNNYLDKCVCNQYNKVFL